MDDTNRVISMDNKTNINSENPDDWRAALDLLVKQKNIVMTVTKNGLAIFY